MAEKNKQPSVLGTMPTDVSPGLRRSAALYAPVTNYVSGSDAAVGKLVDNRLRRSGQPLPSTIGPPAPSISQPPTMLQRMAPASAANIDYGNTARPGETLPEKLGRGTTGAMGMLTAIPEALGRSVATVAGGAKNAGAAFVRGMAGAPPAAAAPAQPAPRPAPVTQPAVATPPAATAAAPAPAAAPSTPAAPAPAPALTRPPIATNSAGQPLPGSPTRGANGEVVYDDAFLARNQPLIDRYQGQNVVQSVVPAPGVAASTVTGGQMPSGPLSRAPQGFTPEQLQARLDNLDRLGRSTTEGALRDVATTSAQGAARAAQFGDAQGAASRSNVADMASGAAAALAAPPRVEPLRRADPAEMARIAIDQQRTDIDASRAAADNQVAGLQAQGQQLQLQQAQQMQQLTQQLIGGTDDQKRAAAASMAALQGAKPGQPIRVKRQFDTGRLDASGSPILGEEELLFDPSTSRWLQPPAANTPTPEQVVAEARAAIKDGASREAVEARLKSMGLSL